MSKLEIIGLMSGTSLDGLDVTHVRFETHEDQSVTFNLLHCHTFDFSNELREKLNNASNVPPLVLLQLDKELGLFFAKCVNSFLQTNKINKSEISAIASHGQTIFHQPQNGFTLQIGCGSTLAYHTGINVINDFRSLDIIAGGQGAPLVPIGDFDLFGSQAESFLNIGGFANMSYKKNGQVIAFDICPGNLPMNKLAFARGMEYDKDGHLAQSGEINFFLLDLLNSLEYYTQEGPKSLGTEWLEEHFYPLLKFDKEIENNLRTLVEHIAIQISNKLNEANVHSVFITGGGAKNAFLLSRIQHYFNGEIILPDLKIIDFKESLVFAYLAHQYIKGRPNTLSSVTGASRDLCTGVLHKPGF